ncbi:MAG: radical SAM protein [Bacteroidales bacterium]|nr:radical SAM protein [Bacteroidales bacterium]
MLSKLHNILPQFLKNIVVDIHKDFRLLIFSIFKTKQIRKCTNNKENLIAFQKSRKYGPLKHICYAPHTSMFFARNGKVSPCYASYNEKSSSIDNESIHDIWFKGSFVKIRKEHENCDFETTCQFCNKLMLQKSYDSLLTNKYEHYAFSKSKYPKIMEFELSNKCNLACIMCDSNLSSSIERTEKNIVSGNQHYDKNFIEQLDEFIPHLQLAEFTGGDPFMIDEYYDIWEKISKINPKCHILITTNANTMNSRIVNLLENHKNIHFNVSIDSLEKENYENIRRNGNFEFALKNLEKFINYSEKNKTNLNLLVCPLTVNRHELGDFVDFANSKNICVYFHTVIKPKELSLKFLDKKTLNNTIKQLNKRQFPVRNNKQKINFNNYQNMIKLFKDWAKEEEKTKEEIDSNYSVAEAKFLLIEKIENNGRKYKVKFFQLLDSLQNEPQIGIIYNKLLKLDDKIFFEHLENYSIEELEHICKTLKTE